MQDYLVKVKLSHSLNCYTFQEQGEAAANIRANALHKMLTDRGYLHLASALPGGDWKSSDYCAGPNQWARIEIAELS